MRKILCGGKLLLMAVLTIGVVIIPLSGKVEKAGVGREYVADANTVLLLHLNEGKGLPKDRARIVVTVLLSVKQTG